MSEAILTVYLPPTAGQPARIRASGGTKALIVAWNPRLDVADNHTGAARALAAMLGWSGELVSGTHIFGRFHVFLPH